MKSWGPAFIASAIITIGCLVFSFVTNTIITTVGNDPVGDYKDASHDDHSDHGDHDDHSEDDDHEEGLGVIFVG